MAKLWLFLYEQSGREDCFTFSENIQSSHFFSVLILIFWIFIKIWTQNSMNRIHDKFCGQIMVISLWTVRKGGLLHLIWKFPFLSCLMLIFWICVKMWTQNAMNRFQDNFWGQIMFISLRTVWKGRFLHLIWKYSKFTFFSCLILVFWIVSKYDEPITR